MSTVLNVRSILVRSVIQQRCQQRYVRRVFLFFYKIEGLE